MSNFTQKELESHTQMLQTIGLEVEDFCIDSEMTTLQAVKWLKHLYEEESRKNEILTDFIENK